MGEAQRDLVSNETCDPNHATENTGSGLLLEVLTRENLCKAWKQVKANEGAPGIGGRTVNRNCYTLSFPGLRFATKSWQGRTLPVRYVGWMIPNKPRGC